MKICVILGSKAITFDINGSNKIAILKKLVEREYELARKFQNILHEAIWSKDSYLSEMGIISKYCTILSSQCFSDISSDDKDNLSNEFELSLNRRDTLDEEDTVGSGLVSGDRLHVLLKPGGTNLPSPPTPLQSCTDQSSSASVNKAATTAVDDGESARRQEEQDDDEIFRAPLTMREASNDVQIKSPDMLALLVRRNRAELTNENDALLLPLHAIMIEGGFILEQDRNKPLISSVRSSPQVYRMVYTHRRFSPDNQFILICCVMGRQMIINASITWQRDDDPPIKDIKIRPTEYVADITADNSHVYRNLNRLYNLFTANIVNWMISTLQRENDVVHETASLRGLPDELQLMIVACTDCMSRLKLMATDKHFYRLIKDDYIGWRRLFYKDHGRKQFSDNLYNEDWQAYYRDEFLSTRNKLRRYRDRSGLEFGAIFTPPPGPAFELPPFGQHIEFPGMIGGGYDLNPLAPPNGLRTRMRPRFDNPMPFYVQPRGGRGFRGPRWDPDGPDGGEHFL